MLFTEKQIEYLREANHRWNIKTGAVRSGKTFSDFYLMPVRICGCTGGLILIVGNTRMSLERNLFEPMRKIWGDELIGFINGESCIRLFGHECFVLGAANANAAEKLQGCSVGYCYGDEITTWSEEVFRMLQSRLDRPDSIFDGTCNPASPGHWLKSFLSSDADIYCQHYTIDDNPRLDPGYVTSLKAAYAGTVYYDRFILGRWVAAEGAIYRIYADNPGRFSCEMPDGDSFTEIVCGLDFGGGKSKTALVCAGVKYAPEGPDITVICSEKFDSSSPGELTDRLFAFLRRAKKLCGRIPDTVYCDSAEVMLIRGLRQDIVSEEGLCLVRIRPALKTRICDRIRSTLALLASDRLHLTDRAATLSDALCTAVWGKNDERLDDFSTDIDTLDAFEYIVERVKTTGTR